MSDFIPLSEPVVQGNEWKYIKECLDTGWVSSAGNYVEKFEAEICRFTGARYAVACVNGTAALYAALRLLNVQADDEVLIPTVTFIAPANAASYLNARPVFMDCDDFYNIDVEKTIQFIKEETTFRCEYTWNRRTGKRISAIVPVHVFGNAADLQSLLQLCRERNIKVVEDATESLGTYYTNGGLAPRYTGTVGDIGCYSFNGNKIITTGGGGMLATNDARCAEKARYWTAQAKDDPVRYIHDEIGYNFRLSNLQAAMGVAQLEKLSEYIQIKKKNYAIYKKGIESIGGLRLAAPPEYADNNYWFYCLQIDKQIYGRDREQVMALFAERQIQTRPIWYLNHLQKPYKDCQSYKIEKAQKMWEITLNLPCSVNLSDDQIGRVLSVLRHG